MDDPVDLVFEGGGVKGVGLAGAYAAIEEHGLTPRCVAGASAGAITAALVAAGYTADELREEILAMDFEAFKDPDWEDRIPVVGKQVSVLKDHGIYEGRAFLRWMTEKLEAKGKRTFADLAATEDGTQPYRLQVIVSDVTGHRMLVLPRDAALLGTTPDQLSIAYAVRMSMSIPIFFEPVVHTNATTGIEHTLVDGGMLSNFPVWLFDAQGRRPRFPTFGLMLVEPRAQAPLTGAEPDAPLSSTHSIVDLLKAMAHTMMEAHDRMHIDEANFARTIAIPTLGVRTTAFDLTRERAEALYESGYTAGKAFLREFDFDDYVATYRSETSTLEPA